MAVERLKASANLALSPGSNPGHSNSSDNNHVSLERGVMPKYQVRVECEYSGVEEYEVDAENETEALEMVKSGEILPTHEEQQCDKSDYDNAEITRI